MNRETAERIVENMEEFVKALIILHARPRPGIEDENNFNVIRTQLVELLTFVMVTRP